MKRAGDGLSLEKHVDPQTLKRRNRTNCNATLLGTVRCSRPFQAADNCDSPHTHLTWLWQQSKCRKLPVCDNENLAVGHERNCELRRKIKGITRPGLCTIVKLRAQIVRRVRAKNSW